jgi:tetratricopeptide (TPR) repeat protein
MMDKFFWVITLIVFLLAPSSGKTGQIFGAVCWQQQTSLDRGAAELAELATRAQDAADYRLAIERWEKLIAEYPDVPFIGKAHHFLGLCWIELRRFELANPQFEQAIRKSPATDATWLPQAYLYLGYTQFQRGIASLSDPDPAIQKEANIWLTTSTETFTDLINRFPEFEDVDQARFFQATAYRNLDRLDEAIGALEKMLKYPAPQFKLPGLLLAGQIKDQQGLPERAIEYYDLFREEVGEAGHPRLVEVELSHGKALMTRASQQLKEGLAADAIASYRAAEARLADLERANSGGAAEVEAVVTEARYQRAFCLANLNRKSEAAALFAAVGTQVASPFRLESLLNSGRLYQELGELDQAISILRGAANLETPAAAEGAVLLASAFLANGQAELAYQTADQWIAQKPPTRTLPFLMNYRAEAAYKIDSLRAQSPDLFLQVADQFPSHSLAAPALYNAAFGLFQLNQHPQAVALVDRLNASYPDSELLAEALEIKADCLLLTDESAAEALFADLIQRFPQHKNLNRWLLREGVAKFIQGNYQASLDFLIPQIERFSEPRQIAEAYHWLGLNQFYLENYPQAAEYLQQSLELGEPWRSTDETLLTLGQCELKNNRPAAAESALQRLVKEYPASPVIDRARFLLGEIAFQEAQYGRAYEHFSLLNKQSTNRVLIPLALYNAGLCLNQMERYPEADQIFSRLIEEFPDHQLVAEARVARKEMERPTSDPRTQAENSQAGEPDLQAMFTRGVALVQKKSFDDGISIFRRLIEADPESPNLDQYYYELAWALHRAGKTDQAIEPFEALLEQRPDSVFAAEAYFHLASAAYDRNQFDSAETAFAQSVSSARTVLERGMNPGVAAIQQKALYKLGWTHYKQEKYPAAREYFSQLLDEFPGSELTADSLFMLAESLFQEDDYETALAAYQKALTETESNAAADPRLKLLSRLHAAQAANKIKKSEIAMEMARPLTATELAENGMPTTLQADAWLEIGTAYQAAGKIEESLTQWQLAKRWGNAKTSAQARCYIGDQLLLQRQFDEAIEEFQQVHYRYGNEQVSEGVQAWVAYALYEAARCHYLQIADASEEQRLELIKEAIRNFETLVENYPNDPLAPDAQKQLEMLKKLRR